MVHFNKFSVLWSFCVGGKGAAVTFKEELATALGRKMQFSVLSVQMGTPIIFVYCYSFAIIKWRKATLNPLVLLEKKNLLSGQSLTRLEKKCGFYFLKPFWQWIERLWLPN